MGHLGATSKEKSCMSCKRITLQTSRGGESGKLAIMTVNKPSQYAPPCRPTKIDESKESSNAVERQAVDEELEESQSDEDNQAEDSDQDLFRNPNRR
jgi:hypothetical protein